MKKLFLALFLITIFLPVWAQRDTIKPEEMQTIFGKVRSHGGYGGVSYRYGIIDDRNAYINGGRGGWILNHSFVIGGGGYGFRTESKFDAQLNENYQITGGYGGLLLEPVLFPKKAVHISIPVLIGAGGITYATNRSQGNNYTEEGQAFFVVEPGIEFELNLFRFMRFGVGAYYRYTSDFELKYADGTLIPMAETDALNNVSFGVTLKFGKF